MASQSSSKCFRYVWDAAVKVLKQWSVINPLLSPCYHMFGVDTHFNFASVKNIREKKINYLIIELFNYLVILFNGI